MAVKKAAKKNRLARLTAAGKKKPSRATTKSSNKKNARPALPAKKRRVTKAALPAKKKRLALPAKKRRVTKAALPTKKRLTLPAKKKRLALPAKKKRLAHPALPAKKKRAPLAPISERSLQLMKRIERQEVEGAAHIRRLETLMRARDAAEERDQSIAQLARFTHGFLDARERGKRGEEIVRAHELFYHVKETLKAKHGDKFFRLVLDEARSRYNLDEDYPDTDWGEMEDT